MHEGVCFSPRRSTVECCRGHCRCGCGLLDTSSVGDGWAELVAAAKQGDAEAFLRIYDLNAAEVHGHLLALGVKSANARVQNAYLQYWAHLPSMRTQSRAQVVQWLVLTACTTHHAAPDPGA